MTMNHKPKGETKPSLFALTELSSTASPAYIDVFVRVNLLGSQIRNDRVYWKWTEVPS